MSATRSDDVGVSEIVRIRLAHVIAVPDQPPASSTSGHRADGTPDTSRTATRSGLPWSLFLAIVERIEPNKVTRSQRTGLVKHTDRLWAVVDHLVEIVLEFDQTLVHGDEGDA